MKKKRVEKHNTKGVKLDSFFLNKSNGNKKIKKRENCVIDYVWSQIKNKRVFKTYSYNKLKNEILRYVDDPKTGTSTFELINWAKTHSNVSVHAFDARYKTFFTYSTGHTNIVLCYIVKDHHLHPILDNQLKKAVCEANKEGAKNILKNLVELKWSNRTENILKLDDINDIIDLECNDTLVVLPEDNKVEEAINIIVEKFEVNIEYVHWSNCGKLDRFIDHRKNMFVLNDDYDNRKRICDKLFDAYRVEDFKCKNQTITKLASSLFKRQNGYLPESSYNSKVRDKSDKFEPRALYYCDPKYLKEDHQPQYKYFDIRKSYPNILLKNDQPIPVYSIHDNIEKFNSIHDLEKTGEFYIDEVILDKYGCDLKIEAGFYSSNLVKYLIHVLKMKPSNIKYKLIIHRVLKPDTFKNFIEYIFDNFDQKEAKSMTNSLIVDLGTKYNKINHGFTCRDYQTAMNIWTSGVAEKMNISIDNYNDLYLIREQKVERLLSETCSINPIPLGGEVNMTLLCFFKISGKQSTL